MLQLLLALKLAAVLLSLLKLNKWWLSQLNLCLELAIKCIECNFIWRMQFYRRELKFDTEIVFFFWICMNFVSWEWVARAAFLVLIRISFGKFWCSFEWVECDSIERENCALWLGALQCNGNRFELVASLPGPWFLLKIVYYA